MKLPVFSRAYVILLTVFLINACSLEDATEAGATPVSAPPSGLSNPIMPSTDTSAPTVPTGLSAVSTSARVSLSWQASSDDIGVSGYEVFRDGTSQGIVTTNQFTDNAVIAGQSYSYQVLAFDLAANQSAKSTTLFVGIPIMPPPADTTAPTIPTGLSSTQSTTQVSLSWQASTDNVGVTGYEIFRDGTSQGTVSTNLYLDTSVVSGQSYSYQVLAFDLAANKSSKSAVLNVTVPSVTPPPDTTAPSVPVGLSATTTTAQVTLNWTASTDDTGVTGYEIFRDGISQGTVSTNQYADNSVTSGQTYNYEVLAFDLAGNISAKSATLGVTVPNVAASGGPVILYTDIVSGPASGGEDNNGAYLSIFGFNFGNPNTLGTTTRLYINDQEVARYMLIKNAQSQTMPNVRTIQQITVQVGALGGATPGVNHPIKLVVDGVASNTDKTFMVQPGDIYYVDNVIGNDGTGVKNDITKPFRFVQTSSGGALNIGGPGDIIVMRGTGTAWTDLVSSRFISLKNIAGSAPNGAPGTGPMTIMGYPGENVLIQCQDDTKCGIHGVDGFSSSSYEASADWITISNLLIRGGGPKVLDGPINLQHKSDNWRIVNNELFEWDANAVDGRTIDGSSYREARAGGITGDGINVKILGNHIHDINGGTKNHGIYVDGGAKNWEIAYNHMERLFGGNIIQTYDSHGSGGNIENIEIHHNRMNGGTRYGVNYSSSTASGKVYDNLIYNIAASGVRLSTNSGTSIQIVNNTLYNTCLKRGLDALDSSPASNMPSNAAAINNDWSGDGIKIQNNILHADSNCSSYITNSGSYGSMVINNNLYTGLSSSPSSRDASAVTGDPAFIDIASGDFRLGAGSAAVDTAAVFADFTISTDFLVNPRVSGTSADIGAIEMVP